jgi:bifunctional non-homologous end joining protein LigD
MKKASRSASKATTVSRRSPRIQPGKLPGAVLAAFPKTLLPQLATLTAAAPSGPEWLHELKFDGYRILAEIEEGQVRLMTRRGNDWTSSLPGLARWVKKVRVKSAILDGELVANDERGRASFQRLQNALKEDSAADLVYHVFDLPYLNGYDLRGVRLEERKSLLSQVLATADVATDGRIRYSQHVEGDGPKVLTEACRIGLEGIVCKHRDSPYESRRSSAWLKVKCHGRQEFVIGGFTKPEGSRVGFGSLLLGYYEGGELHYAGRVGAGFDQAMLGDLSKRLKQIATKSSPYVTRLTGAERRDATFVRPELVCEVEFTEWTEGGHLRHPTFEGLRADKPAKEVVRETPAAGLTPPGSGRKRHQAKGHPRP